MINNYNKTKAIPLIIDLLAKEGINITSDNIKVWLNPTMNYSDVINGCNFIKSLNSNVLVYTNNVFCKENISISNNITILDINDLISLCRKYKSYDLYDLLY